MYSEEIQRQALNTCSKYIELQKQANNDYENVKKIIEQSDEMLSKYQEKYNDIIKTKNKEIQELKAEIDNLNKETEKYKTQFEKISIRVRDKYVKRRIY